MPVTTPPTAAISASEGALERVNPLPVASVAVGSPENAYQYSSLPSK
jgi:hypothetical protein